MSCIETADNIVEETVTTERYAHRKMNTNSVFVLDKNRNPLMPCRPARARGLLASGRASVYRRQPFTIILHDREGGETQPVQIKVDPGSKTTGLAVVANNHVVWAAELRHRTNVAEKLITRRQIRGGRRARHTRYRPSRFDNRIRPKGWLAPSMRSRVDNVLTWVNRLREYAPISNISLERVKFDMQLMQNPEIEGVEYQQGTLYGTEVREYLLHKYNHTCIYCGTRPAVQGTIEHIVPRSMGGSDRVDNLAWACYACNQKRSNQPLAQFVGAEKAKSIMYQAKSPLKDASAVNATRNALAEALDKTGLRVEWGSGGRTAFNRHENGYGKAHWIDAACVGASGLGVMLNPKMQVLGIKAMGRGSRQMCITDKFGFPKRHRGREKRYLGYQTGDLVRAIVPNGKYAGTHVGRITIRRRPSFHLNGGDVHPKYIRLLQRVDGYEYDAGPQRDARIPPPASVQGDSDV